MNSKQVVLITGFQHRIRQTIHRNPGSQRAHRLRDDA